MKTLKIAGTVLFFGLVFCAAAPSARAQTAETRNGNAQSVEQHQDQGINPDFDGEATARECSRAGNAADQGANSQQAVQTVGQENPPVTTPPRVDPATVDNSGGTQNCVNNTSTSRSGDSSARATADGAGSGNGSDVTLTETSSYEHEGDLTILLPDPIQPMSPTQPGDASVLLATECVDEDGVLRRVRAEATGTVTRNQGARFYVVALENGSSRPSDEVAANTTSAFDTAIALSTGEQELFGGACDGTPPAPTPTAQPRPAVPPVVTTPAPTSAKPPAEG